MRLLLDEHLSPKRVGEPLAQRGHDVLALAAHDAFVGIDDDRVIDLAVETRRIIVTRNGRDFIPLLRSRSGEHTSHCGCIVIWSLRTGEFGSIIDHVQKHLIARPNAEQWHDLVVTI